MKYIRVTNEPVAETKEIIAGELLVDVDQTGRVVGVEILSEEDIGKYPVAMLRHAWSWDCDLCGTENFARSITKEVTQDDADGLSMTPYEAREYAVFGHPAIVKCKHCGSPFTAQANGEYDDE